MKLWSAFLRDVRPKAPTIAEPLLEHAILRGAQAFCDYTRAWQVALDPIYTREGVKVYDLDLDCGAELVRLEEGALLAGEPIAIWREDVHGHGRYVFTPDTKTVELSFGPGDGMRLDLRATVRPGERAQGVDDVIFDRYATVIAKGAVVAALGGDPLDDAAFIASCDVIKTRLWRGQAAIRPRARANFF